MKTLLSLLTLSLPAFAHDAPTGWTYPYACCSDRDCAPASIKETTSGYLVPSGETLFFGDRRVRDSPDGQYHWCAIGTRTICLFVPPKVG